MGTLLYGVTVSSGNAFAHHIITPQFIAHPFLTQTYHFLDQ